MQDAGRAGVIELLDRKEYAFEVCTVRVSPNSLTRRLIAKILGRAYYYVCVCVSRV